MAASSGSHPQHPPSNGVLRGSGVVGGVGQHFGKSGGGPGTAAGAGYPVSSVPSPPSFTSSSSRGPNQQTDRPSDSGPSRAMQQPYPARYTSPQPMLDGGGRPDSPTKRAGQLKFGNVPDARERWASIGQMQNSFPQKHGQLPPQFEPRFQGAADPAYFPYGHEQRMGVVPSDETYRDCRQDRPQTYRDVSGVGYDQGLGHGQVPSAKMSPRSLMHLNQQQQPQQQQQQQQQHHLHQLQLPQQLQHPHQHPQHPQLPPLQPPVPATNLGSGLMSNSGQPAEEITTIFIVGFPDDMTEREFANMFLFARGFEASTLKVPGGGSLPALGGEAGRSTGRGDVVAGPGGPYHAVVPGGGAFDGPPNGAWDEHAIMMRQGNDPSYGLNALNLGDSAGRGPGLNAAGAGKLKQIIGFAKFRKRAEALEARDVLNGKKIDNERGCVLKTEMAKKNLHTKQRPVLFGVGQGSIGEGTSVSSYGFDGPRSAGTGAPSAFPSSYQSNGGTSSFDAFARAGGPPSSTLSALSGMISPQGQHDPFGADFLRSSTTGSGISSNVRSGSSGEAGSGNAKGAGSGDSNKWTSLGPLDYFGPPAEQDSPPQTMQTTRQRQATLDTKPGDNVAVNIRPHSHSQSLVNPFSGESTSTSHRGPDWSAIGSPPSGSSSGGGLFASARPFTSSKDKGTISFNAAPFVPHPTSKSQKSEEDFGQGESTMRSTAKMVEESDGDASRDETSSIASSAAIPAPSSTCRTPRGPGNASSAFAARFGSLRLDSPLQTTTAVPTLTKSDERDDSSRDRSATKSEEKAARSAAAPQEPPSAPLPPASKMSRSPTMAELPTSPSSRSFSIDQNPPGNTLFVGNLPASVTPSSSSALEKQLRVRFGSRPGYRQLSYRLKNNGPMCFIEFDNVQSAARALAEVNGDTMEGLIKNGGLRLSFSKNPLFRKDSHGTTSSSLSNTSPSPQGEGSQDGSISGAGAGTGRGASSLGKAGQSLRDDPFDSANSLEDIAFATGFSAGSSHGRLHGLFEGRQLGREKGFEIWDEVGFYKGTAHFWKRVLVTSGEKATRKVTKQLGHIDALERLIAAFPLKNKSGEGAAAAVGASTLPLASSDTTGAEELNHTGGVGGEDDDPPTSDVDATDEQLAQMDMAALLERIRARYKLMCASLGVPAKPTNLKVADADAGAVEGISKSSSLSSAANPKTKAIIAGRTVDTSQLRF